MTDYTQLSRKIGLTSIAPSINLKDRVVVITGGAEGIGGALTRAAHLYGATVIAIDIQEDKLRELERELGPDRFIGITRDLIKPMDQTFHAVLVEVCGRLGRVDAYVMNAGVVKLEDRTKAKDLLTTPVDEPRKLVQLNALSHLELFQALHSYLLKFGRGQDRNHQLTHRCPK